MSSLTFLGDVFLPRPYQVAVDLAGELVLNLEYPITECEQGYPGKINLRSARNHLFQSFGRNPLAVCLANNHVLDYGYAGFTDTLEALTKEGIHHFGAGLVNAGYGNPLVVEIDGVKVGLLGYASASTSAVFGLPEGVGVPPLDLPTAAAAISRLRSDGVDRVVVSVHWGAEEVYLPLPGDVDVGRSLVDAGADLVVGHHAHRIQPYEVYNGKHIFYGLGNCIMPDLSVPAFYDDEGHPTRRYRKRQQRWNQTSLAVTFSPGSHDVRVTKLRFDGQTLSGCSESAEGYRTVINRRDHERRFRRSYKLGMLRTSVANFVDEPKLPRMRHLRELVAVLKSEIRR